MKCKTLISSEKLKVEKYQTCQDLQTLYGVAA